MIRSEIVSDYEAQLKTASAFVVNFVADFQAALVADLQTTVAPTLLTALQVEPPQQETYVFSTPKSRRYYMWAVHAGIIKTDGKNYVRNHGLSQGYKVTVFNQDGTVVMSVRNPANKAYRWVKSKQQTIGHRINGWIPDNVPVSAAALQARARAPVVAGQVVKSGRFG